MDRVYQSGAGRRSGRGRAARRMLALLALFAGLAPLTAGAQNGKLTINPTMARGPAAAPVTIVEFSDYQ